MSEMGQKLNSSDGANVFRFAAISGHPHPTSAGPLAAKGDIPRGDVDVDLPRTRTSRVALLETRFLRN